MRTQPFDFTNAAGQRLSARLDRPDGPPKAYALFAHCFTCDKQAKAAVRIARSLVAQSIGLHFMQPTFPQRPKRWLTSRTRSLRFARSFTRLLFVFCPSRLRVS